MSCAYCGAGHSADTHGALRRRIRHWEEPYPFREPSDRLSPVTVELTAAERRRTVAHAEKVLADDEARGWRMRFEPVGETKLDVNIRGYGAEIAAARATGLRVDWKLLGKRYRRSSKPADIGARVEVRSTKSRTGRLSATTSDPTDRVFLLVTGKFPSYEVVGWIEGVDLKVDGYWMERPEVRQDGWFIDADDLNALPLPASSGLMPWEED